MWELLLEFDYQTVRHAVWAGRLPIYLCLFTGRVLLLK